MASSKVGQTYKLEMRPKRTYDKADIPRIGSLLDNWIDQYVKTQPLVIESFVNWLHSQIESMNTMIGDAQKELVAHYKKKLDEAHAHADTMYEKESEKLSAIFTDAQDLEEEFKKLTIL